MGIRRPNQFEFPFLRSAADAQEDASVDPPNSETPGALPSASPEPYHPTLEEEQEATRLFHGQDARHRPPKTRAERKSERERGLEAIRAIRDMLDGKRPDLLEDPEATIRRLAQPPPKKK